MSDYETISVHKDAFSRCFECDVTFLGGVAVDGRPLCQTCAELAIGASSHHDVRPISCMPYSPDTRDTTTMDTDILSRALRTVRQVDRASPTWADIDIVALDDDGLELAIDLWVVDLRVIIDADPGRQTLGDETLSVTVYMSGVFGSWKGHTTIAVEELGDWLKGLF